MKFRIDRPIQQWPGEWEKQTTRIWLVSIMWVTLICGLVFLWNLGSIGLVDETEPLFAEAARQMTVTGDWITPYFNETTRFDKPPLIYWLMAIAYQVFGVNEWAARLPSALAAIALTGMGFYALRRFGFPSPADAQVPLTTDPDLLPLEANRKVNRQLWLSAWIGSALIALNPQTIVWARTGVSDMLLSGCMGIALLVFFCGYAQPGSPAQPRWYAAFYVFSALAVLAKGPVGIVIPGLVIISFLLYLGNLWTVLREMKVVWGSLLFLAIAVPWYVLVIQANGEAYINSFFGYHNFERFTSVVNRHSAPWYFYFLVVLLGFLPWSIYLPAAIARLRFWRRSHWQQQPRSAHLGLFALAWFGVIFTFFTIAVTKLPSYVLPLLPAAAILVGLLWSDQMARQQPHRGMQISHVASIAFNLILAGALVYSIRWMGDDPAMPGLPQAMQQSGILWWGGAVWLVVAIASMILLWRRQGRWIWGAQLIGFIAFFILAVVPAAFVMDVERQLPLRQLSASIVQVQQADEPIIMVGFHKPSIVFYTQRPVNYIKEADRVRRQLIQLSRDPAPSTVLIVGQANRIDDIELQANQYQPLAEAGVYQLIRVPLPLSDLSD